MRKTADGRFRRSDNSSVTVTAKNPKQGNQRVGQQIIEPEVMPSIFAREDEYRQIQRRSSEFVDEEVKPRAAEIDETDEFPWDLVVEMAELGLMGMPFPEEYGGAGLDYHCYAMALEEISRKRRTRDRRRRTHLAGLQHDLRVRQRGPEGDLPHAAGSG